MRKILLFISLLFALPTFAQSDVYARNNGKNVQGEEYNYSNFPRSGPPSKRFRIEEWNVENLFDTIPSPGHVDDEFNPAGKYRWNTHRYWKKLGTIARVILEAGGLQPVDVVGLCEVENDSVVYDLTHRTRLASLGYEYVITHGKDVRGINAAMLYQPYTFQLVESRSFRVPHDSLKERPTRDILYCSGIVLSGDTLDIFLVHFPSKRGGNAAVDRYRMRAADVVLAAADSVSQCRKTPSIVIMGDCNAAPDDETLAEFETAGYKILTRNVAHRADIGGTYYYQKKWSQIDNFIVNPQLEDRQRDASSSPCMIFSPDYLLEADKDGYPFPYRTYRGPVYHGGTSDHLPVLLDLWQ